MSSEERDGKGGSEAGAPEGEAVQPEPYLSFTLKHDGQLQMATNIEGIIQRNGLWMAGLESMFRVRTMEELEAMATRARIIRPGMGPTVPDFGRTR